MPKVKLSMPKADILNKLNVIKNQIQHLHDNCLTEKESDFIPEFYLHLMDTIEMINSIKEVVEKEVV